jgi:hypothetical protein
MNDTAGLAAQRNSHRTGRNSRAAAPDEPAAYGAIVDILFLSRAARRGYDDSVKLPLHGGRAAAPACSEASRHRAERRVSAYLGCAGAYSNEFC